MSLAVGFEIPVFFNHENGPALTFHPVMEHPKKLVAQLRVEQRLWPIDLEVGDVRQCRDFFNTWLWHGETARHYGLGALINSDGSREVDYVQELDEHAIEFRRLYDSNSLSAFLAWSRSRVSQFVEIAFKETVEPKLLEPKPKPLDTLNCFAVTPKDGMVLTMTGVDRGRCIFPEQALQLASWLIVAAELADHPKSLETVEVTVKAIRAT